MRRSLVRISSILGLFLLPAAAPALAQQGSVTGVVLDAETMAPIAEASITVLGAGDAQAGGVFTNAQGRFTVQLPAGSYSLVADFIGFAQNRIDVQVSSGATTQVEVLLESTVLQLDPIVVTGSPGVEEKASESASNIVTVSSTRVEERVALSPVENVKALPGVDVVQSGLTSSNVVVRGFNNVFSGALLVMTDNRYASVPSLRFNAFNMLPPNQFDVQRIEVLLGPASALYGPNSANGVMHMITSSPIDDPSSKISFSAGERSVFQTQFRAATQLGESAGIKVSGSYFRGDEWEFIDPAEVQEKEDADPSVIGQERFDNIANRDFDSERFGGELRFDYRPGEDTDLIIAAGANNLANSVELTGIGGGQAVDWIYSYGQVRFRTGRTFAQAFINQSDAGDTYFLRSGLPVIDKSRTIVGQVQQGLAVGDRVDLVGGIDLQFTEPRTEGSITGSNEDSDEITEIGGYLQARIELTDNINFLGSARVDDHSELADPVFSPRAALVFSPADNQSFRVSYNRAFETPTTNNLFLDVVQSTRIPTAPVRTFGVPSSGLTFDEMCAGGFMNLCMISPFAPGSRIPAMGSTSLWNALVQVVADGAGNPALAVALSNPGAVPDEPTPQDYLGRLDTEAGVFVPDPFGPESIQRLVPTTRNNFEVGYKGLLTDRLLVSVDLYSQQVRNFIGPLRVETPTVQYDPATVAAFVASRVGPPGTTLTAEQFEAVVRGLSIPVGTVAPDQRNSSDVILTYRNFDEDVNFWGTDLAFQFLATDQLSFSGSYSFVSEECFDFNENGECSDVVDISLNAPQNKGSLSARWADQVSGVTLEGRVRFVDEFNMNSGVYVGTVEGYQKFDANVGYRLPFAPATVTLTATNLFNAEYREFVGAPEVGRLFLARLTYEF